MTSLPLEIIREIRTQRYAVHRSVEMENEYLAKLAASVGLKYTAPDCRKQQEAVAAALTARTFRLSEEQEKINKSIYSAMGIPKSTFFQVFKSCERKS